MKNWPVIIAIVVSLAAHAAALLLASPYVPASMLLKRGDSAVTIEMVQSARAVARQAPKPTRPITEMKQHIQQQVQQTTQQLAAVVRKIETIKLPDPPPDPRPVIKPIMEATRAELVRSADELAKCTDAFNHAVELARQRATEQKAKEAAAAEAARQAAEAERKRQAELLAQALAQPPAPKVPADQTRPHGDADVNAQASVDAHGKQGVTRGASGIGDLKPTYPAACVRRGEEGVITLEWQVLASGKCGWVKIIKSSGNETLDDAAVATVKRAPYRPARSLGRAVDSTMKKTFRFKIVDR